MITRLACICTGVALAMRFVKRDKRWNYWECSACGSGCKTSRKKEGWV